MKNIGFLCEDICNCDIDEINKFKWGGELKGIVQTCDEVLKWVVDKQIDTLIFNKQQISIGARVLWMAPCLKRYIITDTDEALLIENMNMRVQAKMWDIVAEHSSGNQLEQSGWISSYTNELFTQEEMDEYVDNAVTKLKPFMTNESKVLEIGVASGLTCCKIAPLVEQYIGIDISKETLRMTDAVLSQKKINNVMLILAEAMDIDTLNILDQDIVIMNSVCQYFAGYNYLIALIGKLVRCMKEKGIIFLGDILDYELKEELKQELWKAGKKENNKNDLYFPKYFVQQLPAFIPEIVQVEITKKLGKIENELKRYRYDVILHIDCNSKESKCRKLKFQYAMSNESFSWNQILEEEK
jgi:ubiquinone/menaquinone biosynthesis C-methylase UbiE